MDAAAIVAALGLEPHPEGGWYRETWRGPDRAGRATGTAIYYLLDRGQRSHWHRVDADEIWHWYGGAPLWLALSDGKTVERHLLGPGPGPDGALPQRLVPAGRWQSAEADAGWTLVGCTVTPGFEFAGFEMAPPDWSPDQG